jgi:hypothetical protein
LNFWSGIHIYFLVMISLFVVLALGKAFWFDITFSAKSINPIISLTNIALWNECKTNGHFYHMV